MKFIGRERELAELERRYNQQDFQFPVIYGRRRIGKTRLIREFITSKCSIYFMATEQGREEQLVSFSRAIKEQYPDSRTELLEKFSTWETLFDYITSLAKSFRLILVIDEFPYLAKAVPEISSLLQKYIDHFWSETKLYLILCGSSMSFMERQVLGYKSPLYGRRTAQIKLQPLKYYEAAEFFQNWSNEDRLYAFGACGGIPQYLEIFARYDNFKMAVCNEFLRSSGHLSEEPENLMQQELREPAVYNSVLRAIAKGASRQNEIAIAIGKNPNQLVSYIDNLITLGIIAKKCPIESKNSRKVIYKIHDNLYRFWHRFIPECRELAAMGLEIPAYDKKIHPNLSNYFGHIFEDICMEYIQRKVTNGDIDELYTTYGQWWGNNPTKRREEEIDIVCADESSVLVGECKWKNELIDMSILKELRERGRLIANDRQLHYVLFSKNGFTKDVMQLAKKEGIMLVTLDELF